MNNEKDGDSENFEFIEVTDIPAQTQVETVQGKALYLGDTGELPNEARRVLVHLLSNGSIDHSRHPNLWNSLVRHLDKIRSRLADLYLEILIDMEACVAFQRQADTGELEVPRILRHHQLRLYDSLLLLFLRQVLSHAEAQGMRATVSLEEILDHMVVYDPSGSRRSAELRSRVAAAVTRAHTKIGVLYKVPGIEDQYEIARVLKIMLNVDQVNGLRELYNTMITDTDMLTQPESTKQELV